MSVLGVNKDKGAAAIAPVMQEPPDRTGFFQNVGAGFNQAVAGPHSTQNARAIYESRQYDQIIAALNAEGEKATDYVDSPVRANSPFYHHVDGEQILPDGRVKIPVQRSFANPFSEGPSLTKDVNPISNFYLGGDQSEISQIWSAVNRVRARKPGFLKDYADSGSVDRLAQQQRQADEAAAQNVTSRASTLGTVGSFIGGVAGSIASGDPENFVGGWSAPAGKSVARTVLNHAVSGAASNAAAGVIAVPGQAEDAQNLGQPMTTGDMVHSVAETAAAGAFLGGVHAAIPHVPGAVGAVAGKAFDTVAPHLPDAVRDPIVAASIRAGTVKDRGLLYEFQRLHNPYGAVDTSTPTEKAAAHVMTNDVETQEQSPLQPSAAGQNATRLSTLAQSLSADLPPPELPTTAPIQTPTIRDQANGGRKPTEFADALSSAEGTGKNPESSADGYFQFTKGTWLEYAPKVTDTAGMSEQQILALRHDKGIASAAEQRFRADNGTYLRGHGEEDSPGNLSLAHFLGKADAVRVLKAAERNSSAPVESIIDPRSFAANRRVLQGKSADQVIAWAHKRIGTTVDHPPARPDAVPDEGYDPSSPLPYVVEDLRPEELPPTSAQAPTDEPFNPLLSEHLLVWESEDGRRELIDGGKRLAHARAQEDQDITLPTITLREADGIPEEMAMLVGKLKNINLGTTSLEDAAGTLADIPEVAAALRSPQFRQQIAAIAQLPYERFGEVVNGTLDPVEAARKYTYSREISPALNEAQKTYIAKTGERISQTELQRLSWALQDGMTPEKAAANVHEFFSTPIDWDFEGEVFAGELEARKNGEPENAYTARRYAEREAERAHGRTEAGSGGSREPSVGQGGNVAVHAPLENVARDNRESLFDRAVAQRQAAEKFSDPAGPEAQNQASLIEHDLRMDAGLPKDEPKEGEATVSKKERVQEAQQPEPVHLFDLLDTGFRLSEEGDKPVSLKQALTEAESDEAAAKALRDCL